jgi:hypothetical protein
MEIELAALKMQCFRVLDAVLLMILPFNLLQLLLVNICMKR